MDIIQEPIQSANFTNNNNDKLVKEGGSDKIEIDINKVESGNGDATESQPEVTVSDADLGFINSTFLIRATSDNINDEEDLKGKDSIPPSPINTTAEIHENNDQSAFLTNYYDELVKEGSDSVGIDNTKVKSGNGDVTESKPGGVAVSDDDPIVNSTLYISATSIINDDEDLKDEDSMPSPIIPKTAAGIHEPVQSATLTNELVKEGSDKIIIDNPKVESGNGDATESKPDLAVSDDRQIINSSATGNDDEEDLKNKDSIPSPIIPRTTAGILSSTVIKQEVEDDEIPEDVVEGHSSKIVEGEKISALKVDEVSSSAKIFTGEKMFAARAKEVSSTKIVTGEKMSAGKFNKVNSATQSQWEPLMQASYASCCSGGKDHVCFDCFPIPDELLIQIHRQTGMSKLMCLQTVQTVIKFYQHDLPISKFFKPDLSMAAGSSTKPKADAKPSDTSDYSGESDTYNESVFLFKNPSPAPVQRESTSTTSKMDEGMAKLIDEMDEVKTSKAKREAKVALSSADQFRSLVRRLKSGEADFWSDSKNASFVFTFFRKLNKLVVKLDRSILKKLLLEDDMESIWILTRFLRHERRWSIKWEILGVLGTVAARDSRARRKILESDFSVYLSRAVLDFNSEPARLAAYAELLTVLFTGGKPLPISHLEHFNVDFVVAVLNMIEDDSSRPGWELPETFVKLLLAFNLQFNVDDVYDNLTIVGIARVGECKTLTSCLVDLLETKDRPLTASWDVSVSVHQCVIKLTTDVFSCRTTSHVFSPSQSVILSRLLIKSLPNFLPGDKRRTSYLKLIQAILRHCKYHYVRNTPSLEHLEDILLETSSLSVRDQDVIRSIFKQFPQLRSETDIY